MMESSCMLFAVIAVLLLFVDIEGALGKHAPSRDTHVSSKSMAPALAPEGAPAEAPSESAAPDLARGCDESKAIKGYCMHSPSNCINGCMKEGFAGGGCHGIIRRCICSCNAT